MAAALRGIGDLVLGNKFVGARMPLQGMGGAHTPLRGMRGPNSASWRLRSYHPSAGAQIPLRGVSGALKPLPRSGPGRTLNSIGVNMSAANRRGQRTSKYTAPAPADVATGNPQGAIKAGGMKGRTKMMLGIGGAAAVGTVMNRRGEGSSSGRQSAYRY